MNTNANITYMEAAAIKILNPEDVNNESTTTIKSIPSTNNVHHNNSCTLDRHSETPSTIRNLEIASVNHELHTPNTSRETSTNFNTSKQAFQVIEGGGERETSHHHQITSKNQEDEKLVRKINSILFNLGMVPSRKGYKYIRTAVKISLDDPNALDYITKDIYPAVAKIHRSTCARVERNIRSSISDISPDNVFRKEVFPPNTNKLTNKDFIACIVEYMRMESILDYDPV
ncbi:MAG: sporulation initiation factor Spo0A C-terminal domain-containing protein [Lachnospiraceae bacterium]|nr:sporulation initiation factor Spo0A C-terminal domain-containing protein [Lachnospiraceae bacterium]